ncbi:hypothetical protein CDL12_06390 [Handroanthus impetiginosus]|uniref:Uncharacterized protein n=1 Tax=Handroanthus impetiginosus TaxID=429701 RepID=A0A2G9HTR2_9LAMI|nr:hypothetical protein CDL12_06390 [Handroanthus impetiginosus]
MGIELLEIGDKLRKVVMFTIRGCFRSVCNHPFLVGMLCFLIFLYRLSPFIFSLLVSASPVLVCTAVLLGTLLSFGQPNIPEIEIEEKTTHEVVSFKTGVLGDVTVVEKKESYYVERFSEKNRDDDEVGEVRRRDFSDDTAPLIENRSRERELDDGETWEANGESGDLRFKQKYEWNEERLNDGELVDNHYATVAKKSDADSFDSETVNVDSLDSPPRSPWTRIEEREDAEEKGELEDEEDDDLDSGSDRAESSSPDASMADIMPMLDELHPLLDEEAPQPVHLSHGGSDAGSERSPKSTANGHVSDDDSENHEDLEVADDDNEDGEDEEDAQGDKEEETKSAITWTEEDQKNLMDLGSSEIERNQRLESLILRRRARKNMGLFPERSLIDLDIVDRPFNIAPISTRRQNPFDLPNDTHDDSGLPPIPGSAPSILLPRRNPFDIPYDSGEEKPDLMGDGFQEEFSTLQSREPFFRRHESFNVRSSLFALGRQAVKMRPYFVPEGPVSEESSYSPFQRQLSGLSDSKASSVPETESIGSVEDLEERMLPEEDNREEVNTVAWTKEVTEEGPEVEVGGLAFELKDNMDRILEESTIELVEVQSYYLNIESVEQRHSRGSSSSSLSVSERKERYEPVISAQTSVESTELSTTGTLEGDGLLILEGRRDFVADEAVISTRTSVESTDLSITSPVVSDIPHREPVYDSSPRELGKNLSSSSISSDIHQESDPGFTHVLVKRTVSEGSSQETEMSITGNIEMLPESSTACLVDETRPTDVVDIREHDDTNTDFSGVDQKSESKGSAAKASSVEALVDENTIEPHLPSEVPSSNVDKNIKYLLISEEESVSEVIQVPLEGQPKAEDSIGMVETVESPNPDAGVYDEADEKLVSMPSAKGNTFVFHDKAISDPVSKHIDEVQASSTSYETSRDVPTEKKSDMHEIQELDQDISSNINSPLSPAIISTQSSVSETTSSPHMPTIVEEADEIKEIDEGLLSELDNVGDFSIKQWESGSSEFEKHIDSIGESFSSACHAETSTATVFVVDSAEENKIDDTKHPENSREDMNIHEEDMENIDVSKMESNERNGRDSSDQEASQEETMSKENKVLPAHSVVDYNYKDNNVFGVPEVEVPSVEDVDSVSKKAELTSVETASYQGQVHTDATRGMPEVEVSTIEDIDLAFKQISAKEIEKAVVLEQLQAEPVVGETITEYSQDEIPHGNSSVTDSTHDTSVLEVREIEDATSDYKQSSYDSTESPELPELVESGEPRGTSLEVHVAASIPPEGTSLPPKQVLDGDTEEQLKLNTDDELVDKGGLSVEESSVKEVSASAPEKPDDEVESHSTTLVKGKGKISKSSSSSSSSTSSSESSSSDSDRE